jgi:hypothetical protein
MNEFDNLEQELSASIAAVDKPCGCHDKTAENENPFADLSSTDNLTAELETALSSLEDVLEFASLEDANDIGLSEIVSILQKNPGLKITLSV